MRWSLRTVPSQNWPKFYAEIPRRNLAETGNKLPTRVLDTHSESQKWCHAGPEALATGRPFLITRFYKCGLQGAWERWGTMETGGQGGRGKRRINTSILDEHSAASSHRRTRVQLSSTWNRDDTRSRGSPVVIRFRNRLTTLGKSRVNVAPTLWPLHGVRVG